MTDPSYVDLLPMVKSRLLQTDFATKADRGITGPVRRNLDPHEVAMIDREERESNWRTVAQTWAVRMAVVTLGLIGLFVLLRVTQ